VTFWSKLQACGNEARAISTKRSLSLPHADKDLVSRLALNFRSMPPPVRSSSHGRPGMCSGRWRYRDVRAVVSKRRGRCKAPKGKTRRVDPKIRKLTQWFLLKIPIRAFELAQILGQPCEFQVSVARGLFAGAASRGWHCHFILIENDSNGSKIPV
jgi:hypothetical protein